MKFTMAESPSRPYRASISKNTALSGSLGRGDGAKGDDEGVGETHGCFGWRT